MGELSPNDANLVLHLAETFHASLDLAQVAERIVDGLGRALAAEFALVALCDPEGRLQTRARRGFGDPPSPRLEAVARACAEQAVRQRLPLLVDASRAEVLSPGSARSFGTILTAPLVKDDCLRGALVAARSVSASPFLSGDLDLLTAIALPAASAVANAQASDDLRAQISGLRLLHRVSAALTSTLDLASVLEGTLHQVQELLGAATASILMRDGDELVFQVAIGEKAREVKPFRIPLDRGLAGWAVRNGQAAYSNDIRRDPRFYSDVDAGTGFTTLALLAAPLIVNERAIGVIEVSNKPGGFARADLDLMATLAAGAAIAIENARLYQVAVEKARLDDQIRMAFEVQSGLVPRQTPSLSGWEFAALWEPARTVSGDFYDMIPVASHLGLLVADVADKGMPAALFMALTRSTVRASLWNGGSPALCLERANRVICADAQKGNFVTLFYADLAPNSGIITYVNAGHNPPLVFGGGRREPAVLRRTGLPLGIDETRSIAEKMIELGPGEFLVLYTDGVTDALDPAGEEFGEERLNQLIVRRPQAAPAELVAVLRQELNQHIGSAELVDDITVLIARRSA